MDSPAPPTLRASLLRPGQRIAVAVSGGADSVGLLRRLLEERAGLGIVLSVAHVNHGIRAAAADEDEVFVATLAAAHDLPFHLHRTDAPAAAEAQGESLEEAARKLRYAYFRELMTEGQVDAVATGHTLDDQAETVLHKLLRGAWTEGLSGIHPVLTDGPGSILRPFLDNTHAEILAWLQRLEQTWREDATNQDLAHTRNRIRLQLLPLLRTFNPRIAQQLGRLASISADEEAYWQTEIARLLPGLLLPGRPARGGGRSTSTHPEEETVALELARLHALPLAVSRRVLRAAARRLGARLNFEQTEKLLAMADLALLVTARPRKIELPGGLTVERSPREIRLTRSAGQTVEHSSPAYPFVLPGEVRASEYGVYLRGESTGAPQSATLRSWKAGDRVTLRHSRGPKKVAEVLDRLRVLGPARKNWPVVELGGTIVWMRGVEVDVPGLCFTIHDLPEG